MHRDVTDRNLNSPELLLMFFKVKQKQEGKKKEKRIALYMYTIKAEHFFFGPVLNQNKQSN
jgi:hypothetical protein